MGEVIPFPMPAARAAPGVPTVEQVTASARPSVLLLLLSILLVAVLVRR